MIFAQNCDNLDFPAFFQPRNLFRTQSYRARESSNSHNPEASITIYYIFCALGCLGLLVK